ncbi:hypothetical protein FQN49_000870, partial [Arthroderma sp. PD_2]
ARLSFDTAESTLSRSQTSIWRANIFGGSSSPQLVAAAMASSHTAVASAMHRAVIPMKEAPAFAYESAIERPIPLVLPVISTLFPRQPGLLDAASIAAYVSCLTFDVKLAPHSGGEGGYGMFRGD